MTVVDDLMVQTGHKMEIQAYIEAMRPDGRGQSLLPPHARFHGVGASRVMRFMRQWLSEIGVKLALLLFMFLLCQVLKNISAPPKKGRRASAQRERE